jgi:hypothetical protein
LTSFFTCGAFSAEIHPPLCSPASVSRLAFGDHAAVDHEHERLQAEAAAELLDLGGQRLVVVDAALEDLDCDRPALGVAEQPVDDLRHPAAAVARVAERQQRTGAALEVGGGDAVEHVRALAQMPAGEPPLDPLLPLAQPVESGIELVGVDLPQPELLRQGRLRELARAGQLRGSEHPLHDHRERERALARG